MTTTPLDQLTTNPRPSMRQSRLTIAKLLALILLSGLILAGLRSGSNEWIKGIYSLTFLTLVYAGIAARYRGPFWYGFAVAGWAYFVVGSGPWIGSSKSEPLGEVNMNLATSVILEAVTNKVSMPDMPSDGFAGFTELVRKDANRANRNGIGHCALTILFGFAGGLVARRLAKEERESLVAH